MAQVDLAGAVLPASASPRAASPPWRSTSSSSSSRCSIGDLLSFYAQRRAHRPHLDHGERRGVRRAQPGRPARRQGDRGEPDLRRHRRQRPAAAAADIGDGGGPARGRSNNDKEETTMNEARSGGDALFILLGAIMVLAMHAGFAFLELGTVRKKNQVNALVKILVDFAVSTIAYFFIGYAVAYGIELLRRRRAAGAEERLRAGQVLLPADLRRGDPGHRLGRHRRARALRPAARGHGAARRRSSIRCSKASPGTGSFGVQALAQGLDRRGVPRLRRLASSCTPSAAGSRWPPCCCSARAATATARTARSSAHPPSSIPFLALGAWVLSVGWFGFNVMSAQTHRQDLRPGRGQLADGDGGRHAGGAGCRAATTRASSTTARWPGWSRSAPAPT